MTGRTGAVSAVDLHRRVLDDLDQAAISLAFLRHDPVEAVHEARKRIKRTRATLRLLGPIDPDGLDVEDRVLQEASYLLSPIRDRHVAQHLAEKMGRGPGDMMPPPLAPSVRALVSQSSVILIGARVRAATWSTATLDDRAITRGLDRGYRSARKRWIRAADHLEREDLHRCRKALKRSVNQLDAVSRSFGDQPRFNQMTKLGELLGDHHDLGLVPDHDRHDQTDLELRIAQLGAEVFAFGPKRHRAWVDSVLSR